MQLLLTYISWQDHQLKQNNHHRSHVNSKLKPTTIITTNFNNNNNNNANNNNNITMKINYQNSKGDGNNKIQRKLAQNQMVMEEILSQQCSSVFFFLCNQLCMIFFPAKRTCNFIYIYIWCKKTKIWTKISVAAVWNFDF